MTSKIIVNNIGSDTGINTVTFDSNVERGTSNLHSVGVEVAGINVLGADTPIGTGATIYDDGGARFSGIVSATSFVGSGANLTGLSGVSVANQADNRLITATGTTDALNGEANLTFSSNQLTVHEAKLKGNQLLFTTSGTAYLDHSTVGQDIQVRVSTSSSQDTTGPTFKSNGNLAFASGKGIDFSATSGTGTSEILTDYEEGTWTPTSNVGSITTYSAHYVKIGKAVTVQAYIEFPSMSGSSGVNIAGFPFSAGGGDDRYSCAVVSNTNFGGYQMLGQLSNVTLELKSPSGNSNDFSVNALSGKYIVFSIAYTMV